MNYRLLIRLIGFLLLGEAAMLLPSLGVSLYYGEGVAWSFLATGGILLGLGALTVALLPMREREKAINIREGFVLVGLGWMLLSVFGALPFVFSGYITNFLDAVFEATAGFTTTGASVLLDVEAMPRGLLFWSSFMHWVGGMGVLVLTLAIIPKVGAKTLNILRAEIPGPSPNKFLPKLRTFAKALYMIYLSMTLLLVGLLLIAKMPLFDAVVHAFGTAGTGGYSIKSLSIGHYNSPAIEFLIGLFMLLFGVNFSVYFLLLKRNVRQALRNAELWLYAGIVASAVLMIALNIRVLYPSGGAALRHAAFQVSAMITTTGYVTADFRVWPTFSKCILMALMVTGACAGSTGGGMKVARLLLLGKLGRNEIMRTMHPRRVQNVKLDGRPVDDDVLRGVLVYFFLYIAIAAFAMLVVAIDGFDWETTNSAVISALSNIGPGIGLIGPTGNYSIFSMGSKLTLILCMLIGRLEILPILLLFAPSTWKRA